jgi:uncharacterized membrane protein
MAFSLTLYKLLHLIGFSMLFGGMLTSLLIVRREKGDPKADRGAFVAAHLVAAPGLLLLIVTGFAQSFLHQWSEFKGAGFMHAKLMLALIVVVCLAIDIRGQSVMRRDLVSGPKPAVQGAWIARRTAATLVGVVAILCIYVLIVFRPF